MPLQGMMRRVRGALGITGCAFETWSSRGCQRNLSVGPAFQRLERKLERAVVFVPVGLVLPRRD